MAKQKKKKKIVYKSVRNVRKTKKPAATKKAEAEKPVKPVTVEISKAKGRPMLVWVGKKPLERLTAFPAQKVEEFSPKSSLSPSDLVVDPLQKTKFSLDSDWSPHYPNTGLLFHGDNKEVLAHMLANGFRGKVKLIYIDPPFDSGVDYVRRVELRGAFGKTKIEGDTYSVGEQIQYSDIWMKDTYLQFIYERLSLLKELLCENGSIVLHCDSSRSHHLRCIMDEVFGGDEYFRNELIWFYRRWPTNTPTFQSMHDNLFWYTKNNDNSHSFNKLYEAASERTLSDYGGKKLTTVKTEDGSFVKRETEEESLGVPMRDVWEIRREHPRGGEHTDYPTQKPTELIERIITSLSNPGDIILDSFVGSGTTAVVSQRIGRRWIACDINKGAIQTTSKRLQSVISEQIDKQNNVTKQEKLALGDEIKEQPIVPAQLSFSVYRVNDYDLQIQHNEAVNLACEHIGITRSTSDSFFDGTLGKKLVKIVPFNHPATPLDLEQIKNELKSRPTESRDIVVVSLGKEIATDGWLTNWNKLRLKGDVPNKIELIELRTDKKYGRFIEHKAASAKVSFKRIKDSVKITIDNFISPTIIERLNQQEGPLRPQITEWRSMVDCVMIDPTYDGKVFTIALSDVPEKKNDFVKGEYEIVVPKGKALVAIKIIDMLGEEIIVTKEI